MQRLVLKIWLALSCRPPVRGNTKSWQPKWKGNLKPGTKSWVAGLPSSVREKQKHTLRESFPFPKTLFESSLSPIVTGRTLRSSLSPIVTGRILRPSSPSSVRIIYHNLRSVLVRNPLIFSGAHSSRKLLRNNSVTLYILFFPKDATVRYEW